MHLTLQFWPSILHWYSADCADGRVSELSNFANNAIWMAIVIVRHVSIRRTLDFRTTNYFGNISDRFKYLLKRLLSLNAKLDQPSTSLRKRDIYSAGDGRLTWTVRGSMSFSCRMSLTYRSYTAHIYLSHIPFIIWTSYVVQMPFRWMAVSPGSRKRLIAEKSSAT